MKTKQIAIAEASKEQLFQFAKGRLGLDVPLSITKSMLLAKISVAHDKDTIDVPDVDEEVDLNAPVLTPKGKRAPTSEEGSRLVSKGGKGDPLVEMTLHQSAEKDGKRPVFVAVNGVEILVPRGERIKLPYRYFHALENAIRTEGTWDEQSNEIIKTEVPAYPFLIHRLPSDEALDQWYADTHKRFAA